MAEPIRHTARSQVTAPTAQEELERLLQTCHEHGVFRFANDLVGANAEVAQVLVDALKHDGALNAIQNLSILGMALSRIPPDEFYKIVFAVKDALAELAEPDETAEQTRAPGVGGVYRLLHDDELWRSLQPLARALTAFAASIDKTVESPISEFSGKSGTPG